MKKVGDVMACACGEAKSCLLTSSNSYVFRAALTFKAFETTIEEFFPMGTTKTDREAEIYFAKTRSVLALKNLRSACETELEWAKVALEVGEGGLYHLQGYLAFPHYDNKDAKRVRGSVVRKMLSSFGMGISPEVHRRRGSHIQASEYVGNTEKSGKVFWVFEFGNDERLGQGSQGKLLSKHDFEASDILTEILAGASKRELWLRHWGFMVRNFRGVYVGGEVVRPGFHDSTVYGDKQ